MGGCLNACLSRNYVSSNCITVSKTTALVWVFIFRHLEHINCANEADLEMVRGLLFSFELQQAAAPAAFKLGSAHTS